MSTSAPCLAETTAQRPALDVGHVPRELGGSCTSPPRLPGKHSLPAGTSAAAGVRPRHTGKKQKVGGSG